jgi:hypothetical protein
MIIDFKGLLDSMEDNEITTIANEARPGDNYLFNAILPERMRRGYHAKAGSMTIRSTMAKLVGMDSPYPRGGVMTSSSFEHRIAKVATEQPFPEEYLRELRELVNDLFNNTDDGEQQILETMYNFTNKLLVQPHLDTAEWMRAQALITGQIDWQSDDIHLNVDYGIPVGHFLTARTGNDGYGGSTSKFWADWHAAQKLLRNRVKAVFMNTHTLQTIMYNPVNNLKPVRVDDVAGVFEFQRYITVNGVNVVSEDIRDRISIFTYDDAGEVLDPTDPTGGGTVLIPFVPDGAITMVGTPDTREFVIGSGSTDESKNTPITLGYTHVGPTEEGNGRLGRWATAYVPQGSEWMFIGKSAANLLPVIEKPSLIVNMTTDIVS